MLATNQGFVAVDDLALCSLQSRRYWHPTVGVPRTVEELRKLARWMAVVHALQERLFSVYARFIANRTRRDGGALVNRMDGAAERASERKEG